jgi:hypothetical protein
MIELAVPPIEPLSARAWSRVARGVFAWLERDAGRSSARSLDARHSDRGVRRRRARKACIERERRARLGGEGR